MVMLIDSVRAHVMRGWLFAGGCDVKRVLRARDPDVNDAPALPDRQRHRGGAGGGPAVPGWPSAGPVFITDPGVAGAENRRPGAPGRRGLQVAPEADRNLGPFRGVVGRG